jgi:hypothetical protein
VATMYPPTSHSNLDLVGSLLVRPKRETSKRRSSYPPPFPILGPKPCHLPTKFMDLLERGLGEINGNFVVTTEQPKRDFA